MRFKDRRMTRKALRWVLHGGIWVLIGTAVLGVNALALEEPAYTVLQRQDNFELRKYPSFLAAETYVQGTFSEVGNEGFRRLADYIGGENRQKSDIAMTTPVSQAAASEKIAMTAPVSQQPAQNRWRITFMMPSNYTLETLPIPLDERIQITEEPPKIVAAIRYSGTWSEKRYKAHEAKLMDWIAANGWQPVDSAIWARYNPPFIPWFFRRNEILVPVER